MSNTTRTTEDITIATLVRLSNPDAFPSPRVPLWPLRSWPDPGPGLVRRGKINDPRESSRRRRRWISEHPEYTFVYPFWMRLGRNQLNWYAGHVCVLVRKMPLDDVLHSAHDAGRSNVEVGGSCIRYCEEANYKRNMWNISSQHVPCFKSLCHIQERSKQEEPLKYKLLLLNIENWNRQNSLVSYTLVIFEQIIVPTNK